MLPKEKTLSVEINDTIGKLQNDRVQGSLEILRSLDNN